MNCSCVLTLLLASWLQVSFGQDQDSAPLAVLRARPNKLLYVPGEEAWIDVALENGGPRDLALTLKPSLAHGASRHCKLPEKSVSVPAKEALAVRLPFKAGPQEYGYLARVDFFHEGQLLTFRSDVFAVTADFHEVAVGGSEVFQMTCRADGAISEEEIRREIESARQAYVTKIESVFWAPSDWGRWMPGKKRWMSGQGHRFHDRDALKQYIAVCHEHGIQCVGYIKSVACGPAGLEIARRHPDWFAGNPFGVWDLDSFWLAQHWDDEKNYQDYNTEREAKYMEERVFFTFDHWIRLWPDFTQLEVLDYGIDDVLGSIREFGWDGMRFDGHWLTMESLPISLRNARRMKERIWKEHPDFQIGFNYGYNPAAAEYRTGKSGEWSREDSLKEIQENMAGGGEYMPEALRVNCYVRGARYQSWRHLADLEGEAVELLRRMGGTYSVILEGDPAVSPQWVALKMALILSAGGHPEYSAHQAANGQWCENWGRYLLRWSALIWDYALYEANPEKLGIQVEGPKNLYWKRRVYERIADANTRQIIVHLHNLPADDRMSDAWSKKGKLPESPKPGHSPLAAKGPGDAGTDHLGIDHLETEEGTVKEVLRMADEGKEKEKQDEPEDPLPPLKDIRFRVEIPKAQNLVGLCLIDPSRIDEAIPLNYREENGVVVFGVEAVSFWSMVVLELKGAFERPSRPPKFGPPPDAEELKRDEEKWAGKNARLPTLEVMRERVRDAQKSAATPRTIQVLRPGGRRQLAPVVEDVRASVGKAERHAGTGDTAGAAFGTASPFRIDSAGRYHVQLELLFEADVTEETLLEVVIEHHDETVGRLEQSVGSIRAQDVRKNEYQTHGLDFVHRFPANLGITLKRKGPGAIRCGTITFQLLERFNESQIVEVLGGPKMPAAVQELPPGWGGSPDVLVLAGWFYPQHRFHEVAIALHPEMTVIERGPSKPVKTTPKADEAAAQVVLGEERDGSGLDEDVVQELDDQDSEKVTAIRALGDKPRFELSAFIGPELTYENIFRRDAVILADVHGDWLGYAGRKMLYEFVQAGGTLIVLGGGKSYGYGNYSYTFMEELLPVEFTPQPDLAKLDPPGRIPGLTPQATVHYIHALKPKADATVRLCAVTSQGERLPFLLEQRVGKGRVIACLGSVFGESRHDGDIPFWEWE
ncbi:MAG: hypothetical protein HYU36_01080 [Planctomycetes bacterium]|nr:hypothetical protein [Planctomycetota bacterium]